MKKILFLSLFLFIISTQTTCMQKMTIDQFRKPLFCKKFDRLVDNITRSSITPSPDHNYLLLRLEKKEEESKIPFELIYLPESKCTSHYRDVEPVRHWANFYKKSLQIGTPLSVVYIKLEKEINKKQEKKIRELKKYRKLKKGKNPFEPLYGIKLGNMMKPIHSFKLSKRYHCSVAQKPFLSFDRKFAIFYDHKGLEIYDTYKDKSVCKMEKEDQYTDFMLLYPDYIVFYKNYVNKKKSWIKMFRINQLINKNFKQKLLDKKRQNHFADVSIITTS